MNGKGIVTAIDGEMKTPQGEEAEVESVKERKTTQVDVRSILEVEVVEKKRPGGGSRKISPTNVIYIP